MFFGQAFGPDATQTRLPSLNVNNGCIVLVMM